eukprot:2240804-Prymnesium_polylepis.1
MIPTSGSENTGGSSALSSSSSGDSSVVAIVVPIVSVIAAAAGGTFVARRLRLPSKAEAAFNVAHVETGIPASMSERQDIERQSSVDLSI